MTQQERITQLESEVNQTNNCNLYLAKKLSHLQGLCQTQEQEKGEALRLKQENKILREQIAASERKRECLLQQLHAIKENVS